MLSAARERVVELSYLGNLPERSPFLPEVDDYAAAPFLGFLNCLLDPKDKIRPASTDVRSKDVAAIAL